MQSVFYKYEAVTYMRSFFSKSEGKCSQTMKEAAKDDFQNHLHHHKTMKAISPAYLG